MRRLAIVWIVACSACATSVWPGASIPPDYALGDGMGVVLIGEVYVVSGAESASGSVVQLSPIRWTREGTGREFTLESPAAGSANDHYVALAPGWYRTVAATGVSLTERSYVLRIRVEPNAVLYAGTIRRPLSPSNAYTNRFVLVDDYAAVVERFRAQHPDLATDVRKSLFQIWSCGGTDCVEQTWEAHGSP